MRIGVVGSGIAGLFVSRELALAGCKVVLIERQPSPGIDAHSVEIAGLCQPSLGQASGSQTESISVRADVPSRMFNPQLWPGLWQCYQDLEIAVDPVDTSQSLGRHTEKTWLKLSQATKPVPGPGSLLDPGKRSTLKQAARLMELGLRDWQSGFAADFTFRQYLEQAGYDRDFIFRFLYPNLSSTVLTCSFESLDEYPASMVLSTLHHLVDGKAVLFRSRHGTQEVARRLLHEQVELRCEANVQRIFRLADQVRVCLAHDQTESFDHVVVATQANTALKLVTDLTNDESSALVSFSYESIPVFVHTDRSLMPPRRKDWSTFNMLNNAIDRASMCTVWLNRFHHRWPKVNDIFQTINAFVEPDAAKVIKQVTLQRPVVNRISVQAKQSLNQINQQPGRRLWFCGSYAGDGAPLLESGLRSAQQIARQVTSRPNTRESS